MRDFFRAEARPIVGRVIAGVIVTLIYSLVQWLIRGGAT